MRAILPLVLLVGCHSTASKSPTTTATAHDPSREFVTISHFAREVRLTRADPVDEELGIRLLRVEGDGTTVIHVAKTDETLAAKPGEPFLGRRGEYNVRIFGERGLTLVKSDPSRGTATLERRWAESR
jgi:hypothetical protein